MGKSLIIKDADFSENGIKVEILLGTLKKVNGSAGLNVVFNKSDIVALNPSGNSIKVLIGTNDATINTSMQNKSITYIKAISPYTEYGTKKWGSPLSLSISDMSIIIICQVSGGSGAINFENIEMWLKVYE